MDLNRDQLWTALDTACLENILVEKIIILYRDCRSLIIDSKKYYSLPVGLGRKPCPFFLISE